MSQGPHRTSGRTEQVHDDELEPYRWLRALHGAAWWFVHAARLPGDLPAARQRLAGAVALVSAGLAR